MACSPASPRGATDELAGIVTCSGGFGLPADVHCSFDQLVRGLVSAFSARHR
jgi:hypothetical protein